MVMRSHPLRIKNYNTSSAKELVNSTRIAIRSWHLARIQEEEEERGGQKRGVLKLIEGIDLPSNRDPTYFRIDLFTLALAFIKRGLSPELAFTSLTQLVD